MKMAEILGFTKMTNIHNDELSGSYLHLSFQVISVAVKKAGQFEKSMDRVKLFR